MAKVGNLIVVGTYEEFVLGYAIVPDEFHEKKLTLVQTFACHSHRASVRSLAVGGTHLASGSTDETVRLYDIVNQVESGLLTHHDGTVNALAFTENGSHLITAGEDGTIAVIRTGSWFTEKKWVGTHSGSAVTGISVHPSGKLALSIGADNRIVTWNLVKGRKAYVTNVSSRCRHGWGVGDVQWSPSGSYYAVYMSSHAEVYSVEIAGVSHTISCSNRVTSIAFLDDNTILVGEESGEASIHNLEPPSVKGTEGKQEEIARFQAHERRVKCAKYLGPVEDGSRSALHFVTAGGSGRICLWELEESEVTKVCEVGTGCRVTCMTVVDLEKELKLKEENEAPSKKTIPRDTGAKLKTSEHSGSRKRKVSDGQESKPSNKKSLSKVNSPLKTNSASKTQKNTKMRSKTSNSEKLNQKVRSVNAGKWVVTPLE
ncbi:p21-activated protein kinase-interacting protein 1-like [Frankliniella fusca]|uniref:P21-activated protein kinase-interacting protein 1-like n=1 Tax=Frankliniella fusca TaxID=407009 RepID=A0AAE1HMF8_9NEOP|nr:p21-activated protein kinase-interacting protein 1-like [Frankliniella fusca]